MQFSFRAAIVIAAFCAASLAGYGTPGFAFEPDKSVLQAPQTPYFPTNATLASIVPTVVSPIVETAPAAQDAADAEESADEQSYESLAAAVSAQSVPETVSADLACLAGTIYFEAKGEPLSGQLAVAQVVLNRTQSGRFPKSICSVVMQRGQFSFIRGGKMPAVSTSKAAYRTAMAVAQVALDKAWEGPAANALFFHARRVSPGWRMTRVASIGGHVFYR